MRGRGCGCGVIGQWLDASKARRRSGSDLSLPGAASQKWPCRSASQSTTTLSSGTDRDPAGLGWLARRSSIKSKTVQLSVFFALVSTNSGRGTFNP